MKKIVRKFAWLLAIAMLFTSIQFPTAVKAASNAPLYDATYNTIMSTANGGRYYITSQPSSALPLESVTELTVDNLSPNYTQGVVDLPRLAAQYYYAFSGSQTAFYLGDTVYPTLCWTDSAKGQSVTLCIYERNTNAVMYSCTIVNRDLDGVDMSDFEDCSTQILSGLVDAGQDARLYEKRTTIYSPDMHKSCIVMPGYVYTPDEDYPNFTDAYSSFDVSMNSYAYKRRVMTPSGVTSTYNVKDYLEGYATDPRSALLFAGSKFEDCSFDGNTGAVTTKVTSSDLDELYFFIATNDKCYFSVVMLDAIPNEEELTKTDPDAKSFDWVSSQSNSVRYDKDHNPDYTDFGPISYDEWFSYAAKTYGVDLMSGKYSFTYHGDTTQNGVNLYAYALMYAGVAPHAATLNLLRQPTQVQIEYMVMTPTDTAYKLVKTESFDAEKFSFDNLLKLDKIDNYEPVDWCIDPECTQPFRTNATIDPAKNSKYTLYSNYKWAGGKYSVTFYNDVTNVQTTQTFNMDEMPVLPANPEAQPGYGFRNWYIVDSVTADDGTPYVASTFKPEENRTYLFKTMWDVKGVITQVLTSKLTYYIGDKVDKDLLKVYIQYDNEGNTRVLESSEFELEQDTITKSGVHQFWVIYPATNARGMCEITGLAVAPMKLDATYLGGDVTVGTSLKTGDFRVNLTYNNGNSELINQFNISPTTVSQVGDNNVTISYGDLKTTLKIKGITKDNPTGEELTKLEVKYVGSSPKLDQKVNANDLLVVATYGSRSVTLYSDAFQYSPDKFSSEGTQRITVVYGGKSASCDVTVTRDTASNSNNNNNNNNNNSNNNNNNSTTTTPNKPNTSTSKPSSSNNTNNSATTSKDKDTDKDKDKDKGDDTDKTQVDDPLGLGSLFGDDVLTPKGGLGTSIGYMHGSNILTNVMSSRGPEATVNEVDVLEMIHDVGDNATSLTVTLVNGASGNDITPEMLELVKDKTLSLYINMVSPLNQDIILGRWIIVGGQLDNTEVTLNPNIAFETIDKKSDRLHTIQLGTIEYPMGVSVTAYPAVETYGSGQLIRLYSCSAGRTDAELLKTFPWQDSSNTVELDPYKSLYYCLSDSLEQYPDKGDLNVDLEEVSVNDPVEPTEPEEPTDEVGDDFWDETDETQPVVPEKKGGINFLLIALGLAGLLLLILIITMVVLIIKRRKPGNRKSKDDDEYDDEDVEYEGYDDEEEPGEDEEDEPEPSDDE